MRRLRVLTLAWLVGWALQAHAAEPATPATLDPRVETALQAAKLAYGIDGFHVDMLDQGFGPPYGCWCAACRQQFEAEIGAPMPEGATWDEGWDRMLEFRYRSSERFEKTLAAHVKSFNPRASVDFNYHGNPPFSFEVGQRPVQHAGHGDFITGETGVWGFSALGVGLNAEFYRAATPGLPASQAWAVTILTGPKSRIRSV